MSFDLKISNGDLAFDLQGRLELVRDTNKLVQDVLKIIETSVGSDPFDLKYGVSITEANIGKVLTRSSAAQQLQAEIQVQLQRLIREQVALSGVQVLTLEERIRQVDSVSVEQDPQEPRQINISIELTTQAQTPIVINETVVL